MQNQKFGGLFVPGGPTFAGTPELQSILIKLNNTKFEKKISKFFTLTKFDMGPLPFEF